jgi:UDP-sugar transporter A1/2/3
MSVPAILYFFQNNLQYVAVTLLDAATFQVTYQLKIITTVRQICKHVKLFQLQLTHRNNKTQALFSVMILRKSLSRRKWIALILLTAGIAIVQYPSSTSAKQDEKSSKSATEGFFGLLAVGSACLLSGLAGVWFEKVLKGTKASLFLRNIQLSLFSIVPGLVFGGKSRAKRLFCPLVIIIIIIIIDI